MNIKSYNDIFKSGRKANPNDIPREVLCAYDKLEQYIKKENCFTAERMISQLLSFAFDRIWGEFFSESNRVTPVFWLKQYCNNYEAFPKILKNKYDWLDHSKILKDKDSNDYSILGQPYREFCKGIDLDEMQELINVCNKLKIDCRITATSMHYPGQTIGLLFSKPKNESKSEKYKIDY